MTPGSGEAHRVSPWLVALVATCCGVTVMNIYLAFPLITVIAQDFGVSSARAATVATVSQVGYAVGLFFLIPLGDAVRRRPLLMVLIVAATLGLVVAATAANIQTLTVATFVLSGVTVAPHVLIPLLVGLVGPDRRGRALAAVNVAMTSGIAFARVGGGWLGSVAGSRWVYAAAAVLTLVTGLATAAAIPPERRPAPIRYLALLASTLALLRTEPSIRWAIALQVPVFATFNIIWSMLVLLVTGPPFSFSVSTAGLFGLLGLAPLLTARFAGRLLDARGSRVVITGGLAVLVAAAAVLQFSLSGIALVIAGVSLLAVAQQAIGLGNQTRILTLRADARSRMNTLYMTSNFLGGSAASAIAVAVYAAVGWWGIAATAMGTAVLACLVFAAESLRSRGSRRAGLLSRVGVGSS